MMKITKILFSVLGVLFILMGCSGNDDMSSKSEEERMNEIPSVSVSIDDEEIQDKNTRAICWNYCDQDALSATNAEEEVSGVQQTEVNQDSEFSITISSEGHNLPSEPVHNLTINDISTSKIIDDIGSTFTISEITNSVSTFNDMVIVIETDWYSSHNELTGRIRISIPIAILD